jgi:hypothetical protein
MLSSDCIRRKETKDLAVRPCRLPNPCAKLEIPRPVEQLGPETAAYILAPGKTRICWTTPSGLLGGSLALPVNAWEGEAPAEPLDVCAGDMITAIHGRSCHKPS